MKNLYLLSGLGADKRVFDKIELSKFNVVHVIWIEPKKSETIEEYASRLVNQITSPKPILIGVSFGGIMAIEIAKLIETEKVVLLSSAQVKNDLPLLYRIIGRLGIIKIVPASFFKNVNSLTYWFFGVESKEDKILLKSIIKDTDPTFLKWAIQKIANWKNQRAFDNIIHIHGSKDRILPRKDSDFQIEDGGHLMILSKHEEITPILNTLLDD